MSKRVSLRNKQGQRCVRGLTCVGGICGSGEATLKNTPTLSTVTGPTSCQPSTCTKSWCTFSSWVSRCRCFPRPSNENGTVEPAETLTHSLTGVSAWSGLSSYTRLPAQVVGIKVVNTQTWKSFEIRAERYMLHSYSASIHYNKLHTHNQGSRKGSQPDSALL
ncbi:hypothetical protein E2C01_006183 [Portunus trituberculatus]|uniref:Uncharacterized protein n=1 Tax=Portunus trituberculatus TaxID=210409 RepID=A0A5B7CW76_PORTR|nr:hypothetical protein [Portunus trituberculatus]